MAVSLHNFWDVYLKYQSMKKFDLDSCYSETCSMCEGYYPACISYIIHIMYQGYYPACIDDIIHSMYQRYYPACISHVVHSMYQRWYPQNVSVIALHIRHIIHS